MTTTAGLVLAARLLAGAVDVFAVALAFLLLAFVLLAGLVAEAGAVVVAEIFVFAVDGVDEIGVTAVVVAGLLVVAVVVADAVGAAIDCVGVALVNVSLSLVAPSENGQKTPKTPATTTNSNRVQKIFIMLAALNCPPLRFYMR